MFTYIFDCVLYVVKYALRKCTLLHIRALKVSRLDLYVDEIEIRFYSANCWHLIIIDRQQPASQPAWAYLAWKPSQQKLSQFVLKNLVQWKII